MSSDLVLTVDIGTGSCRALIYDIDEGRTLATNSKPLQVDHPAPGRAEFSTAEWWKSIIVALRGIVTEVGRPHMDYLGLTVTSLRQGFVLYDQAGTALGPGVMNDDRRGEAGIPIMKAEIDIKSLYQLTGHWLAPELTLPKLLWYREHQSEVWSNVAAFYFIHDWLIYYLTGHRGTNATMACAGQMADIKKRSWASNLLKKLGIPKSILPPIYEAGTPISGLRDEVARAIGLAAGTPVHIGGSDIHFGSLAAGGLDHGKAVIVGGSITPILLTTNVPTFDPKRYPWVSTHLMPEYWALEMNAGHTGMIYKWFRETFGGTNVVQDTLAEEGLYKTLSKLAQEAPLGANGLRVIASSPRWSQDTWEKKAPYAFFGFEVSHTIREFARAVMESVCYAVRGNIEQIERVIGEPIQELIYTGRTTQDPFWVQMMSDVLGRPLLIPNVPEPAASAGAQVVLWGQGSTMQLPAPPIQRFKPDTAFKAAYQEHYQSYVNLFETFQTQFGTA
jgi:sugar (pentulose or hexulose) kinase